MDMAQSVKKKKNPIAVAFGKLGASKGGNARAAKLSAKRRSDIARQAVLTRWSNFRKMKKIAP
jgi:hypothetical protein